MKATLKLLIAVIVAVVSGSLSLSAEPPAEGSIITLQGIKYGQVKTTSELTNSADNPYKFTGSINSIESYTDLVFSYNGQYYSLATWTQVADISSTILTQVAESNKISFEYSGPSITTPTKVVATLSEDQKSMTVQFLQVTPLAVVVNGTDERQLCDDITATEQTEFTDQTPIQVQDGGSVTVAVKIGGKTYGVASDAAISFDAADRGKQVKTAALTESADAVTLNQKGIYTVAVTLGADGGRTLTITKAAAGNEMTFGEGNGMVFDDVASTWSGTAVLKANAELPALTYTVYGDDGATTATYWFAADIDDPKGEDKTATLTATEPAAKAKCLTAGTYKLTVTLGDDGSAKATYRNTTPPVEIKDLYICVYDKHYAPDQYNNYSFGYYNKGATFSVNRKVTYRDAEGNYRIAIYMNEGQAFYIMNNGVAYRPTIDVTYSTDGFGTKEKPKTVPFYPSDDVERRMHVSNDAAYRMLTITPNGSNIDVQGYKMTVSASNSMNIINSLSKPDPSNENMADVLIHFTGDESQGYLNEYRKMTLNPSGTHGLYDLRLKAGQTFEIWRGRAIYGADGKITGIEDKDKVQYGCNNSPAAGATSVTITDGDISDLFDQYNKEEYKTNTYSVIRDGEFSFVVFYTTATKQLTVSRRVLKDRGIKIAIYDENGVQQGDLVDMQYKNTNRRNLMTVQLPKGGYAKFGTMNPHTDPETGKRTNEFEPFSFYNLGHSNEAGYDTQPEEGQTKDEQFNAIEADYAAKASDEKVWYRFRIRLREDGNYYLTYQTIPMPDQVWLYVTSGGNETTYTAEPDAENPGHYVFKGVDIPENAEYYFVNTEGGKINDDTTGGLIWYCAHSSSMNGGTDGNPVEAGRWINMFSHLNVGTDYQGEGYSFSKFKYYGKALTGVDIDMDISTMSHRYGVDYSGQIYYFEGNCAGIQDTGEKSWNKQNEKFRMIYNPTTGYYTCFLEYLWGDWFIYNYDDAGAQQTAYYPFNLNNVIHELNEPYYLSDGQNRYVSDAKKDIATGTAAKTAIDAGADGFPATSYKDRFMIAMAPGAEAIIQGAEFQDDWVHSPVYKDVTVVFDPANNVLWLVAGHTDGDPTGSDPYGECYIVFTDVEPADWAAAQPTIYTQNTDNPDDYTAENATIRHWVRLKHYVDPATGERVTGRFVSAEDIKFPARIVDGTPTTHSSYFFTKSIGSTLAETIRYSNTYHAGTTDPTDFSETATDEEKYGSVFTKLVYNETGRGGDGSFESTDKPMSLVNAGSTAYASTIYVRRWDHKDGAPVENCYKPTDEGEGGGTAPEAKTVRRAESEDAADADADNAGSNAGEDNSDAPVYVTTTDDAPSSVGENDCVIRTFASEPYTYSVTVDLGRQQFSLVTTPRDVTTGIGELPSAEGADEGPAAVIRAAAGHISVTGAHSVSVYTLSGQCLLNGAQEADMDVAPGIYIIVADGRASKFAL